MMKVWSRFLPSPTRNFGGGDSCMSKLSQNERRERAIRARGASKIADPFLIGSALFAVPVSNGEHIK